MYINFLRVTIPEDWGDLAIGSIGGMMDPDAAGFDLEDDSYKAAKVHTKHPTLLENSACSSVGRDLKCHQGITEASLDFGWLSDWDLGAVYSEWVDKIRDWVSNVNR